MKYYHISAVGTAIFLRIAVSVAHDGGIQRERARMSPRIS